MSFRDSALVCPILRLRREARSSTCYGKLSLKRRDVTKEQPAVKLDDNGDRRFDFRPMLNPDARVSPVFHKVCASVFIFNLCTYKL